MKRFLTFAVVGVMALGLSSVAYANYCSFDAVPSATLLFPFVAYDYEGGFDGQTTQLAITNVSSEAQIVHITIWTDYSVAILDFNVVLTGYDVVRMNIRDILAFGLLPTEDADTNRADTIWQHDLDEDLPYFGDNAGDRPFDDGPYSSHNQLLGSAPSVAYTNLPFPEPAGDIDGLVMLCNPFSLGPSRPSWIASPNNYVEPIPQGTLDIFEGYLRASQTAAKTYLRCNSTYSPYEFPADPWFITREDGPAWLYVTADVVRACNKDLPDSTPATYFAFNRATTFGVLDENVLIGDTIWLDSLNRFSEADHAVHLEADPGFTGAVTFYERYLNQVTDPAIAVADYREPLPTAWAFRYQYLPEAGINTWVRAFKASTTPPRVRDLATSRVVNDDDSVSVNWGTYSTPGPATLYANTCIPYTYWAWDEAENVNTLTSEEDPWSGGPASPIRPVPNLLPLETQEVEIDQFFLVGQSDGDAFGWLLFAWPSTNFGVDLRGNTDRYQTWMGVKYSGFGDYTAAMSGAVMANYNCNTNETVPLFNLGRYTTWNVPAGPPTE